MIQKPTISLHAPGVDVVLSNRAGRFVLMQGATGLGVAPRDLTVSDLPGGGGVLRHARSAVPRVTIPILLGGDYEERAEDRRTLERLSEGDVEIRVTQPDGESRSRTGVYVDGLDGDYGAGEDSPDGQKLVLTFDCPDYRWFGPQREESWSLSPKRTAWLSRMRDEPNAPRLVRTNHILNPSIVGTAGRAVWVGSAYQSVDSSASTEEPKFGSTSWRLEVTDTDGDRIGGRLDTDAAGAMRYKAGLWMRPGTGVRRVQVYIESDQSGQWETTATESVGAPLGLPQEWAHIVVEETQRQAGNRRIRFEFSARHGALSGAIPVGSVSYVDGALLTDAESPADFFDGDTTVGDHTTTWTGDPHSSSSQMWTVPGPPDGILAVPFGVMRLSESTVQGSKQVEIAGDADAEAVLIIDGPGEDLEVVNETTSQRIFITGDIDETLTIDSRGGWQDIYSDSMRDGEWWARVNEDAPEELITLAPGQNLIRVTMVNAHPQSKVRLLYRETYRAGH